MFMYNIYAIVILILFDIPLFSVNSLDSRSQKLLTGVIHNSIQGLNLQLCNTKEIILNIH